MNKEIQRAQQLSNLEYFKAIKSAEKQCKLIKSKDKAWNRFLACKALANGDNERQMTRVSNCFFYLACELGHERAIAFKSVFAARREHKAKLIRARKRVALMPTVEKFVKAVEKRVGINCRISTMCGYPYWNNEGLFVSFDFLGDDAPYIGYDPSGATCISTYRRTYLGKNLSKIATITRRFECDIYKSGNSIFAMFKFPKPLN